MSSQQEENLMFRDEIASEHAIDLVEINNVPDMKDYIKGVAAVVGASKIVSAYRKNGKIRIYLRHVSCVEEVVHAGVRVLGRQADVDYRIKSATKVLLSNVESEISNSTIENMLANYGDRISRIDILRLGLNDPEYSHIESNMRQVHMRLYPGATIPRSLEVCQNGKKYKINVKMEKTEEEQMVIGEQEGISNPAPVLAPTLDQTANSVQGSTLASPRQAEGTVNSSMGTSSTISSDQLQSTSQGLQRSPNCANRRGRSRGRPRVERNTDNYGSSYRQQISPSNPNVIKSKRSNKVRRAVYSQPGNHTPLSNGQFESEALSTNVTSPNATVVRNDVDSTGDDAEESHFIPVNFENLDPYNAFSEPGNSAPTSSLESNIPVMKVDKDDESYQTSLVEKEHNFAPYPLTLENLENFLEIVKNDSNPLKNALKMLENNKTPGAIDELCEQIVDYSKIPANAMRSTYCQHLVKSLSGGLREMS